MPSFAATAATWRVWFDWMPPIVTSVSQPCCQRVGHEIFELPHLVAAESEAAVAIVALGENLDLAAEMFCEPLELLDRGRAEVSG